MSFESSRVDEKAMGLNGHMSTEITARTITSDSGRLHALDQLEVLPKILQEGVLFAGSGAALLLQAAMPGISEGAAAGPDALARELLDAMQAHISYIAGLVYGTRAERKSLLDLLHRGQTPLMGGGRNNRFAQNPRQQLWMAATLYATATDMFQRVYGRIDLPSANRAYSEFTLLMNCLGVSPEIWPESRQTFWTYWDDQINQLMVTSDATRFAEDLSETQDLPRWALRWKPYIRAVSIEMLTPRLREAYGLRSTRGSRTRYRAWLAFSHSVYPAMPTKWRSQPLRHYHERLLTQI